MILIEADLRRPSIGRALGMEPKHDLMDVILDQAPLEDALAPVEGYENFSVLMARDPGEGGAPFADGLFLPTARTLLERAKEQADFVLIDSPPLTEVIDGLALAEHADELLLVIRLGRSLQSRVIQLGELLAQHGIEPVGHRRRGRAAVGVRERLLRHRAAAGPPSRARARRLRRAHDRARTVAAERRAAAALRGDRHARRQRAGPGDLRGASRPASRGSSSPT